MELFKMILKIPLYFFYISVFFSSRKPAEINAYLLTINVRVSRYEYLVLHKKKIHRTWYQIVCIADDETSP